MHYYTGSARYNNINIIIITTMTITITILGLEEASNGNHTDQEIRSLAAAFLLRGTYVLTYLHTQLLTHFNYSFFIQIFCPFFLLVFSQNDIFWRLINCLYKCMCVCVCDSDHAHMINLKEQTEV